MKKKFWITGVAAVMCLSVGAFAAGCGNGDGGETGDNGGGSGGDDGTTVTATHHEAVPSTCTTAGSVEYWEKDGKFYSDADCTNEITETATALDPDAHKATGNWVADTENHKHYKVCEYNNVHKLQETDCSVSVSWTATETATADRTGTVVKKCTVCEQALETKSVTYHVGVAPTCSTAGTKAYYTIEGEADNKYSDAACNTAATDLTLSATGIHVAGQDYGSDASGHWHICSSDTTTPHAADDKVAHTAGIRSDYDATEGKFYQLCVCGYKMNEIPVDSSKEAGVLKFEIDGVKHTINNIYDCYDAANEGTGVGYDALTDRYFFNAEKFETEFKITETEKDIEVYADRDESINQLHYAATNNKLYITGTGLLNVVGVINSAAEETVILNKGLVVGYGLIVRNLTVGDADGETNPNVIIKSNVTNNFDDNSIRNCAYRFLSGNVSIINENGGFTGIDIKGYTGTTDTPVNQTLTDASILVGARAQVVISGFPYGINSDVAGATTLTINGKMKIEIQSGAGNFALNNMNTVVDGGTAIFRSSIFCVNGGSFTVKTGSTVAIARYVNDDEWGNANNGSEGAAFQGTSITVEANANVGIYSFSRVVYNGATYASCESDIVVVNMRDKTQDDGAAHLVDGDIKIEEDGAFVVVITPSTSAA